MPAALPALLNYGKNVRSVQRELDAREIVTRAFPKGAAEDGYAMTMADHRWYVSAIAGQVVTLLHDAGGNPIRFEGQLNGCYARKWPTSAQWLVVDTDVATQTVELEDVPDTLVVGDYLQFRAPDGSELVYLDRPDAQASYGGVWEAPVEREDIPNVDNLAPNGFLETWAGGLPTGFGQIGGLNPDSTITQNAAAAYRQYGRHSAHVEMFYPGGPGQPGISTDWIAIHPTAERPYFTFQAAMFLALGAVCMDILVDLIGDGTSTVTIPDPTLTVTEETSGQSGVRNNVFRKLNVWTYAGIGGLNLYDDPHIGAAKRVKLRIYRASDIADIYLDAVMVTQTAGGSETWYDRLASNALWHAALDALEKVATPIARYNVQPLDLFREDPDAFAYDELVKGGRVRVRDIPLGIEVTTRIRSLQRDLTETGVNVTELELTNEDRALTRELHRSASARPRTSTDVRRSTGKPELTGTGGALSGVRVSYAGGFDIVEWDHNEVIQTAAAGRFTVSITSTLGGSLVTGRDPQLEFGGTDTTARRGSYRTAVTLGGATRKVNVYTVLLYDGAVLAGTYRTSRADFYA